MTFATKSSLETVMCHDQCAYSIILTIEYGPYDIFCIWLFIPDRTEHIIWLIVYGQYNRVSYGPYAMSDFFLKPFDLK